jgi:hypothetical protein
MDPGQAVSTLQTMTELINSLFERKEAAIPESFQVLVDQAKFLEVGRVFKRVFRPNAANVIFSLGGGNLRIVFHGGGCELKCDALWSFSLEMKAKAFAGIFSEYGFEKSDGGQLALTFRPFLGEFATPKAGAKAKYSISSK